MKYLLAVRGSEKASTQIFEFKSKEDRAGMIEDLKKDYEDVEYMTSEVEDLTNLKTSFIKPGKAFERLWKK